MSVLVTNIGSLVTNDPSLGRGPLGMVPDAALVTDDAGRIAWVGPSASVPAGAASERVDAGGRAVIPGFVDSHSHPVFAGDRAEEFAARMAGRPYSAGGITTTVAATRAASDEELAGNVQRLVDEAARSGTTTMEMKSGYGLTLADELRSLHIARSFTEETTFLGAHVVPAEYRSRPDDYVDLVVRDMIPVCAPQAKWVDVFCDRGAFDADQAKAILTAGMEHGLLPRLHANQLEHGPGLQLAVELGAASADHATFASAADIEALAGSSTVVTLLPGAEFSTRAVYPDARRFLDAGITVALAADCNPGSSYTTNIPFCIAVAVRDLRMTPDEALWAATAGGAQALRREDIGWLTVGARADFSLLDAPSHIHLAYRPGVPLIRQTWRSGIPVNHPEETP